MEENDLATQIFQAAFEIHSELGPGLLESVYEVLLASLLRQQGLSVERQKPIPLVFRGLRFDEGFRADLVVNGKVLVELKSVDTLINLHKKQVLTYLRLGGWRLGLLINFNSAYLREGICRVANGMPGGESSPAEDGVEL